MGAGSRASKGRGLTSTGRRTVRQTATTTRGRPTPPPLRTRAPEAASVRRTAIDHIARSAPKNKNRHPDYFRALASRIRSSIRNIRGSNSA